MSSYLAILLMFLRAECISRPACTLPACCHYRSSSSAWQTPNSSTQPCERDLSSDESVGGEQVAVRRAALADRSGPVEKIGRVKEEVAPRPIGPLWRPADSDAIFVRLRIDEPAD
eukprot:CAMPEP_0168624372 /NCGR_PEP_ID=MMETSP0449_2-20121227/9363_1 /TAXON_ID=1082188 /ORGANISM="Strombidium rassoulzadegani, Strain ras09" /LENGTH=114 /DNA_ID=CAMNT_0008665895 /DNA_START=76 /DNA_END=417 /DNA_ORIENTATION=+